MPVTLAYVRGEMLATAGELFWRFDARTSNYPWKFAELINLHPVILQPDDVLGQDVHALEDIQVGRRHCMCV
jgi:hypothetical protein